MTLKRIPEGIVLSNGRANLRVLVYSRNCIRLTRTGRDYFRDRDYNIVTAVPEGVDFSVGERAKCTVLETAELRLSISEPWLSIKLEDGKGRVMYSDRPGYPVMLDETDVFRFQSGEDGTPSYVFDRKAYSVTLPLCFADDEAVYGFGSHEEGVGNLRGARRHLYQQNLKAFIPAFVSTKGYGMLFNAGCAMIFDDTGEVGSLYLDCVDELDYFIIAGGDCDRVHEGFRFLTGPAPMLPKYAFGYIQSKERYVNAEELVATAAEYRSRGIPLDIIVQDWHSWPEGQWGEKNFDRSRYPDPQAMTDALHKMNCRVMLSIWPRMDAGSNREEMLEKGLMLGDSGVYNAFDPEARMVYWRQRYDGLAKYGIDGWGCDCSEPYEADWHGVIKPEPTVRYNMNTGMAMKYMPRDQICQYSLYHAMGMYEGHRRDIGTRVLNLTRSAYAGQHRYGTVTWSGDVNATWRVLKDQIAEGCNFTAAGEPYWTVDIGAFFVRSGFPWFIKGDFEGGADNPGYREIYTRWLQYGAFLPMMRSHGTDTPREVWRFGEKGDMFYDAITGFIDLRYKLLPYIYSLAAETTFSGRAIMKHPGLAYPEDPEACAVTTQFMLGSIMVCPVTEPMYYDCHGAPLSDVQKTREVYLPAGLWYDFSTGARVPGTSADSKSGIRFAAEAPIDRIPLFVPAGAIITTGPAMQHTGEFKNEEPPLYISVYADADGRFAWYDDNGVDYAYENGEYCRVYINWNDKSRRLTLKSEGSWPGMPDSLNITVRVYGEGGCKEKTLKYGFDEAALDFE